MIKTIAFDLGGVVITIDQPRAVSRFKEIGLADAEQRLDPYTQTGIFGDLEHGLITAEDFRVELGKLIGHEVSVEQCAYAWQGYAKSRCFETIAPTGLSGGASLEHESLYDDVGDESAVRWTGTFAGRLFRPLLSEFPVEDDEALGRDIPSGTDGRTDIAPRYIVCGRRSS